MWINYFFVTDNIKEHQNMLATIIAVNVILTDSNCS